MYKRQIRDWLANEQGLEIPYKTVHQTVRYKLKAKLKVARPTHRLRAEMAVVDFKKAPRTAWNNRCFSIGWRAKTQTDPLLVPGRKPIRFKNIDASSDYRTWDQTPRFGPVAFWSFVRLWGGWALDRRKFFSDVFPFG